MDVQAVLNVYACIMYIVAYVTKDEREMGEVLLSAKKEYSDQDIRTQMKKIGSVFLTHREVSAQEAVFRPLGLTMLFCTVILADQGNRTRRKPKITTISYTQPKL